MTPGAPEAWRDACLDAIATIRAAIDRDTDATRILLPAEDYTGPEAHALTTIAAIIVMETADREGISTGEYLDRLTRRTIMGGETETGSTDGGASLAPSRVSRTR
jgi:hypothetical protein